MDFARLKPPRTPASYVQDTENLLFGRNGHHDSRLDPFPFQSSQSLALLDVLLDARGFSRHDVAKSSSAGKIARSFTVRLNIFWVAISLADYRLEHLGLSVHKTNGSKIIRTDGEGLFEDLRQSGFEI